LNVNHDFFSQEVFPYRELSEEDKKKYAICFSFNEPVKLPFAKIFLDKVLSGLILLLVSPIILIIVIAYLIEGLFDSGAGIWPFYYYMAVSEGKAFRKYKFRSFRKDAINTDIYGPSDWRSYIKEWSISERTVVGNIVKNFYLDELPQLFSVLVGRMSLVGPRPLAIIHYDKDLLQGNIFRKYIRGGLLGLGHIRKGTAELGNPKWDFKYMEQLISNNSWALIKLDFKIIYSGINLMRKGQGL